MDKFKVGDKVIVIDGNDYAYTKTGSIGTVMSIGSEIDNLIRVRFEHFECVHKPPYERERYIYAILANRLAKYRRNLNDKVKK